MNFVAHRATVGLALAMAPVGFAFGLVYFAALRRSVARLAAIRLATDRSWLEPVALTLGRWGAASLLATFAGFLLARAFAVRVARRTG